MRRSITTSVTVVAGLILIVDLLVVNPSLGAVATALQELLVLLAAAAAVGGTASLAAHHLRIVAQGSSDRLGSFVLLIGMGAVLVAGLRPGSSGSSDPIVLWLVAALLVPIAASLFALLFLFLLAAARRGLLTGGTEMILLLATAAVVVVLLLPLGGKAGEWLAAGAGWVESVPLAGVFRGLLIGVAIIASLTASRILLGIDRDDE
jgi:hypothetical protein